ncbi:AAA family ATPase [Pantoea agglomerans]|uniref:AAA family ATPase n=1 Tax=Enterobacter agglomerans TaxID=549 RepID=UPI003C7BE7BC
MTYMTNAALSPEKLLWLNAEEHVKKLTGLYQERKGHLYVQGWTGTGKSVVGRELAARLNGDYFSYELLTSHEYEAGLNEMISRIKASDKAIIILDGFFPAVAAEAMSHQLREFRKKGVSLFIFSQEPLIKASQDVYLLTREINTIAEFRYSRQAGNSVTFCQIK